MTQRNNFQPYDFTLTPGGSQTILVMGEYFRIQSATGAVTVTVEGYGKLPGLLTGQGLQRVPYSRLLLTDASGAANAGVILCSGAEFVDNRTYGVNSLDAPTIASLKLPTPRGEAYSGFSNVITGLAAATAEAVFLAAANINGAIIQAATASLYAGAASPAFGGLIAKNGAPANLGDGLIVAPMLPVFYDSTNTIVYSAANLQRDVFLPAGVGLYWLFSLAVNAGQPRSVRFKLL